MAEGPETLSARGPARGIDASDSTLCAHCQRRQGRPQRVRPNGRGCRVLDDGCGQRQANQGFADSLRARVRLVAPAGGIARQFVVRNDQALVPVAQAER